MKFNIQTWKEADGTFTAYCVEKPSFFGSSGGGARYSIKLTGFDTREEVLAEIKRSIDAYLTPSRTKINHGVYP